MRRDQSRRRCKNLSMQAEEESQQLAQSQPTRPRDCRPREAHQPHRRDRPARRSRKAGAETPTRSSIRRATSTLQEASRRRAAAHAGERGHWCGRSRSFFHPQKTKETALLTYCHSAKVLRREQRKLRGPGPWPWQGAGAEPLRDPPLLAVRAWRGRAACRGRCDAPSGQRGERAEVAATEVAARASARVEAPHAAP